jgi:hypothetical protein
MFAQGDQLLAVEVAKIVRPQGVEARDLFFVQKTFCSTRCFLPLSTRSNVAAV